MVQFAQARPAIGLFQAGMQRHANENRAERGEFEREARIRQSQGVDTALRESLAPQPAIAGVTATPAPITPQPAPSGPIQPQFESIEPDHGGDTPIGPIVQEVQPGPSLGGGAVPQAAASPAIADVRATPRQGQHTATMGRLAKTPGSGSTMLTLAGKREQAEIQAIKALHNMQPDVALALANQYGLNIPPEAIKSQKFQMELSNVGKQVKAMGISDDAYAAAITRDYLKARSSGMDEDRAWQTALSSAKAPAGKVTAPKRTWDANRGAWMEEPSDQHPQGRSMTPPGTPPRQFKPGGSAAGGGAGGGGGKAQAYAEWRIKTLMAAGMPENQARLIVAGRGAQVGPKDAANLAAKLSNQQDARGNPLYKTYGDALRTANEALGITAAPAAPSPSPAPAAPQPAAPARPRLRFDETGARVQ